MCLYSKRVFTTASSSFSNDVNTKHIDIKVLWMGEMIQKGKLSLSYKGTDEMLADGLTKPCCNLTDLYCQLICEIWFW